MAKRINKDDVERLSRGRPSRAKAGSRSIGHRLTQRERALFEGAKRQGFLKLPAAGVRENVINVYRLWCAATGGACVITGGNAANTRVA
jgi:hypothetical protein